MYRGHLRNGSNKAKIAIDVNICCDVIFSPWQLNTLLSETYLDLVDIVDSMVELHGCLLAVGSTL